MLKMRRKARKTLGFAYIVGIIKLNSNTPPPSPPISSISTTIYM